MIARLAEDREKVASLARAIDEDLRAAIARLAEETGRDVRRVRQELRVLEEATSDALMGLAARAKSDRRRLDDTLERLAPASAPAPVSAPAAPAPVADTRLLRELALLVEAEIRRRRETERQVGIGLETLAQALAAERQHTRALDRAARRVERDMARQLAVSIATLVLAAVATGAILVMAFGR
jgi:hypothetical protein